MTVKYVLLESEIIRFQHRTITGFQTFGGITFWGSGLQVSNSKWSKPKARKRKSLELIRITQRGARAFLYVKMQEGWSGREEVKSKLLHGFLGRISVSLFPPDVYGQIALVDGEIRNPEEIERFVTTLASLGFDVIFGSDEE